MPYICIVFFMVLDFKVNNEDWLSVKTAFPFLYTYH